MTHIMNFTMDVNLATCDTEMFKIVQEHCDVESENITLQIKRAGMLFYKFKSLQRRTFY